MNQRHRRGLTLLDTILAAAIGAAVMVPTIGLSREAIRRQRRSFVQDEMALRGEALLDAIRIEVGNRGRFAAAANGVLPPGIAADRSVTCLPGEVIRERVTVSAYDSNRDLLNVSVVLDHLTASGGAPAPRLQLVTQIAEPW